MEIIAYGNIAEEAVGIEVKIENKPGDIYCWLQHPKEIVVNMPYKGEGKSNTNADGWKRDYDDYFNKLYENHPEYFSPGNRMVHEYRNKGINIGDIPERYQNYICDQTFIEHFPQFQSFEGEKLIHHHIGQDGQAVATPESIHSRGHGGIHNAEKLAGITARADDYTQWTKEQAKKYESLEKFCEEFNKEPEKFQRQYIEEKGLKFVPSGQKDIASKEDFLKYLTKSKVSAGKAMDAVADAAKNQLGGIKLGTLAKGGGLALGVAGTAIDIHEVAISDKPLETVAKKTGGWVGAWEGAKLLSKVGAAGGRYIGGRKGEIAGGISFGLAGGYYGYNGGEAAVEALIEKIGNDHITKVRIPVTIQRGDRIEGNIAEAFGCDDPQKGIINLTSELKGSYTANPGTVVTVSVNTNSDGSINYKIQPNDDWDKISARTNVSKEILWSKNPKLAEQGIISKGEKVVYNINDIDASALAIIYNSDHQSNTIQGNVLNLGEKEAVLESKLGKEAESLKQRPHLDGQSFQMVNQPLNTGLDTVNTPPPANDAQDLAGTAEQFAARAEAMGVKPGIRDLRLIIQRQNAEIARLQIEREQYQGEPLTREKAERLAESGYVSGEDKRLAQQNKDLQTERTELRQEEILHGDFGRQYRFDSSFWRYIPDWLKSEELKFFEQKAGDIEQKKQDLDQREEEITAKTGQLQVRLQTPEARAAIEDMVRQYMQSDTERIARLAQTDTKLTALQQELSDNIGQTDLSAIRQQEMQSLRHHLQMPLTSGHSPALSPDSFSGNPPNTGAMLPVEGNNPHMTAQPDLHDVAWIMRKQEEEKAKLQKESEQLQGKPLTREEAKQKAISDYTKGDSTILKAENIALDDELAGINAHQEWIGKLEGNLGIYKYLPDFVIRRIDQLKVGDVHYYEEEKEKFNEQCEGYNKRSGEYNAKIQEMQKRLNTPEAREAIAEMAGQYMADDKERLTKLENVESKIEALEKVMTNNMYYAAGLFVKQESDTREQSAAAWRRITEIVEVEPRPDWPGAEKVCINPDREYRLQAKAITEREGCWPGQAADREIAARMYSLGYSRANIAYGISYASPEAVSITISGQGHDYGRSITAQVEAMGYVPPPPAPGLHLK